MMSNSVYIIPCCKKCLRINNLRGKLIPFWLISFFVFAFWLQKRFLVKNWQLMFFSCPVPARRFPRPSAVNAFGDFNIRDELKLAGTMGAIHSTKISGNFGPKLNGSVWSNCFEKTGPPFEVDHFSRSDRLEFWLNGSRPM